VRRESVRGEERKGEERIEIQKQRTRGEERKG
jgi:hypothetical protein